jgi:lipopolysaccharide biosynthesis glycosyltransferase
MVIATVVDNLQWKYIFPNILVLEHYKTKYRYVIFTSCSASFVRLKSKISTLNLTYGTIEVKKIPNFYKYMGINHKLQPNHEWITSTTLDRFLIPTYSDFSKFIYLDVDTLIFSEDIINLFEEEVSEKGISAVPSDTDIIEHTISFSEVDFLLDKVNESYKTFNAGICLFDADRLRKHDLLGFVKEVYDRAENTVYINDEIILNLYDPQYNLLDEKYNTKAYLIADGVMDPRDECIIHFSGSGYKPWNCTREISKGILKRYYGLWDYYYYSLFNE